jgi:hypothetical protein
MHMDSYPETPLGPGLKLRPDCRLLSPDHSQCTPGTCTNAGSECKPIEIDLFQAVCHSSLEQDGESRKQRGKII